MLHLLPIRLLLITFAAAVGLLVLAAFYTGHLAADEAFRSAQTIVRWSSSFSIGAIILLYAAWRWIPAVQSAVFPYLGGEWTGDVRYDDASGLACSKSVSMQAKHSLFSLKLLLESDESTSTTLVVHAEKDDDFDKYRLFYVYLNQRKEGVVGAGAMYRGLAITRWVSGTTPGLEGDYFTDTHRRGTLHLQRTKKTAFWKLWR